MSALHSRRLLACTVCFSLGWMEMSAQDAVAPLLPVKEPPLLLRVPRPPSDGTKEAPPTLAPTAPFVPKTASSTSSGKQFTVHGADLTVRSAFCLLCEDTAAALGRVLKDDGQYVLPVAVVLKTPPEIALDGPAVRMEIELFTNVGFRLRLQVQLRTGFRVDEFQRELVRTLLAERILRNHKDVDTSNNRVLLPPWVMTGVAQALEYRSRSRPSALFSAVFRRGQVYSLDKILAADPAQLDALSRGIYETSSCALVLTLLDQPDGPVRFSKFLNALAVESRSDRDLLKQHFPNLASSKNALEKWWTLQMASLATPGAMETLGVSQTEDELDAALMLTLPGAKNEEAKPGQAAEQRSGGILGWLKREPKEETAVKEPTPAAEADTEKPKAEDTKPEAKVEEEDSKPFFQAPLLPNPFTGGKRIIFPFSKKKPADDEADKKDDVKPKPDAKKPETAASKPKPETPAASLSRKPGESRSIGGRPEDLPKAPPVTLPKADRTPPGETTKGTVPPQEPARQSPQEANRRLLNPRNWFRKDKDVPPDTAEKTEPSAKPAPKPQERAGAQSASRNAPSGSLPLEDFALIAKHPDRIEIYNRCVTRLSALKQRAHPLYKPLIADYIALVQELAQGKVKGASTKLEGLRSLREATHAKAAEVESHLDWYEANHTGTLSHAFDDFLNLDAQLEKERLPRTDSLSKYLDAVEKEYR